MYKCHFKNTFPFNCLLGRNVEPNAFLSDPEEEHLLKFIDSPLTLQCL